MTPDYQLVANGDDFTALVRARLIALTLSDEVGINSDTVEIHIDDRDNLVDLPPFGADLQVSIGYKESGLVNKGHFRVDEVEAEWGNHGKSVLIRGRAADTNATSSMPKIKAGISKTWLKPGGQPMTIAEIAADIAGRNGLSLTCDPLIGQQVPVADQQTGESDLHYLGREARNVSGQVKVANGAMLIFHQAVGLTASGKAMPVFEVIPSDTMGGRCLLTRRSAHKKAAAKWTDANGVTHTETEESDDADEEDSTTELPEVFPDRTAASNAARAKVSALDTGSESVSLIMVGNPKIGAEVKLNLKGFKKGVDRVWIVERAHHQLTEQGYTTEVECVKELKSATAAP